MDDSEAVEVLLTFFVPRRDVKQAAKIAVKRFGSFRGVVDANEEELAEIDGIGRTTAANLKLVRLAADHYLRQRALVREPLSDRTALHDYCRSRMGHLPTEEFRVFYLDTKIRIVGDEQLDRGTVALWQITGWVRCMKLKDHSKVDNSACQPGGNNGDNDLEFNLDDGTGWIHCETLRCYRPHWRTVEPSAVQLEH